MEPLVRVAFVCPRMTNSFSRTIWYSLRSAAAAQGVRLTAVLGGGLDHPRLPVPARRVYDLLDERNFDGVLLYTAALGFCSDQDSLQRFLSELAPLPAVSLGVLLDGVSSVAIDQAEAIGRLVTHLHEEHGHRRFAFVCGPLDQIEARIRHEAFLTTVANLGVPDSLYEVFPGNYDRASGAAAVRALATTATFPIALVCSNDEEALGALDEAKTLGLAVPGQLAVAGFDDVEQAHLQEPSLTSVGQPLIRQAALALELLVRRVRGDHRVVHLVDRAEIQYRESCGCAPPPLPVPSDKVELLSLLLATQTNVTEDYLTFVRGWISDYLTAFEYLLETGNASVLRGQWSLYYQRITGEHERGVSYRRLFAGLESLFGHHPAFPKAIQQNIMLAGASESRKGARGDQATRTFFFLLHHVEALIGQVNDRETLASLPFSALAPLGLAGLALVRFGAPPSVVYFQAQWAQGLSLDSLGPVDYPALLPTGPDLLDQPSHRVVVALTAESTYLGYAVFWTSSQETFVCDFLANQFAGTLHRVELLEQIKEQQRSLEVSLEETQRMQKQLVETEKVASLGRLVAGVAHEINTPLGTGITGTSFLLDRLTEVRAQFEAGLLARSGLVQFLGQGQEALDGVLRNLMKAGELIQAFKGLGLDHGQGEWKPVRLGTLFGDLGAVYSVELLKRGISLRIEVASEDAHVYSQPSALVQVAGELLENAMEHAFPDGATAEPQVLLQVGVNQGFLRLAVTDNGRGLGEDERRHLFDPLFTTRRPEGHAGLGLHLAFQLITRTLGGQMTVASEPGAGSCFLCLIPLKTVT